MRQEMRSLLLGLFAGGVVTALAAAALFANGEAVLRSSFAAALTHASTPAAKVIASAAPISGSEDFWLTAMGRDGNVPMTKTVAVGDQIAMTLGGDRRTFEVAAVSDFAPKVTQIDTTSGPSHFVLVTARDVNDAGARPLRFVMELEQAPAPLVAGRAGRAL